MLVYQRVKPNTGTSLPTFSLEFGAKKRSKHLRLRKHMGSTRAAHGDKTHEVLCLADSKSSDKMAM